jgi:excisionase family DNA binding protein
MAPQSTAVHRMAPHGTSNGWVTEDPGGAKNHPVTPHSDPLELMTIDEIARLVKRHPRTLHRDIAAGRLRTVHLGRSLRVPRVEVERYVYGDNGCEQDE